MAATVKNRRPVKAKPLLNYREQAALALTNCINSNQPFTVDTVRLRMPNDVKDAHYNVLPQMFAQAQRDGRIVRVGSVRSPNRSRKGGWNALWMSS